MVAKTLGMMQIGKQGLTDNFISGLKSQFKNYRNMRISVLKNAGRDKAMVRDLCSRIVAELGRNYTARVGWIYDFC